VGASVGRQPRVPRSVRTADRYSRHPAAGRGGAAGQL
jgi:hypothetical protein